LDLAFLQGTQALRVTVSETLRRFNGAEAVAPPSSCSRWILRGPDPDVDSEVMGVSVFGVLDDALGSL